MGIFKDVALKGVGVVEGILQLIFNPDESEWGVLILFPRAFILNTEVVLELAVLELLQGVGKGCDIRTGGLN